MNKDILFIAVLMLAIPNAPMADKIKRPEDARRAALAYLEAEFARAATEPDYWRDSWRIDVDLSREQIELGQPFQLGRLLSEDLRGFAESGEIKPRFGFFVYFPVFQGGRCLKLLIVSEEQGEWRPVGRKDWGKQLDSLAVALASDGVGVTIITIKQMGGLIVLEEEGGLTSVMPLGESMTYLRQFADRNDLVPYDRAIRELRPRAAALAKDHERYMEGER